MTRTLLDKLGHRADVPWRTHDVPPDLADALAPPGEPSDAPRWILAFVRDRAALAHAGEALVPLYPTGGWLWLAYPKRSGRIATDLTRDVGWEPLTTAGFLPVAQIALDDTWSALRFRRREEIKTITRREA